MEGIPLDIAQKAIRKLTDRRKKTLEILGEQFETLQDIDHAKNDEIFQYLEIQLSQAFDKIASLEATEEDKIRYTVVKDLFTKCVQLRDNYSKRMKEFEKEVANG